MERLGRVARQLAATPAAASAPGGERGWASGTHPSDAIAYTQPGDPDNDGTGGAAAPWKLAHRKAFEPPTILEDAIYGRVGGAALLADIAYPATAGTGLRPAIISVHGGRWRAGHKRDTSAIVVPQWAALGFFAMAVDYRLTTCAPAPACYQDVQW